MIGRTSLLELQMMKFALLVSALLISGCSMLGMNRGESAAGGATSADAQVMRDIAQANLAEIATGKLAIAKAQSPNVKQFGQHMIEEHTTLQSEGASLASAKGMPVPNAPDARHQAAAKKLEAMSGESFDRAYMEQMVKDHSETLQLLQRAASQAGDPQLRAHAQKAMPHVQQHLEMAKRLAGEVVGKAQ
jgi:putative membrane protein